MKLPRILKLALCLPAAALMLVGCIKEDRSDCPPESALFTVKAYARAGTELTAADVSDVILYVFDGDLCFVEERETQLGQTIQITPPAGGDIHVVAWGNVKRGNQTRPVLAVGDHKNSARVSLLPDTRAASPCNSPDDLFLGEVTVAKADQRGTIIVPMTRAMGSMCVTIKRLREYAGATDNDFSILVRETCNAIDFYRNRVGEKATYRPACNFQGEVFNVPAFNMMPESAGVAIDVYHGTTLLFTVDRSDGQPIAVTEGELTQVLIDLGGTITVGVEQKPWGSTQIDKEY